MPKPKKNESKQDFLGRCTRELIEKEGRKSDQAYAMCNAFWDESHQARRDALLMSAPLELAAASENADAARTFMITAYTGAVVESWFGKIVFDVAGMKAKAKIPALREHMRDRVVGTVNKAWADKSRYYLSGEFSRSTPDGKEVLALADEGFPWQASVGIWPKRIEVLEAKVKAAVNGATIEGPAEIWRESLVGEISFVALGRDDNTAAIVLSDQGVKSPVVIEQNTTQKEAETMTLEELRRDHPQLFEEAFNLGSASIQVAEIRTQATQAERTRIVEILSADGDRKVTLEAIQAGTPAADTFKRFYEAEKAARGKGLEELKKGAPPPVGQQRGGEETTENFMGMVDEHRKANKCSKGDAIQALRLEHPEAYQTWLDSQQKHKS